MAASSVLSSTTATPTSLLPTSLFPQNPPRTLPALRLRRGSHAAPRLLQGMPRGIQAVSLSHGSVWCSATRGTGGGADGESPVDSGVSGQSGKSKLASHGVGGLTDLVRGIFGNSSSFGNKMKEKRRANLKRTLSRLEEYQRLLMETSRAVSEIITNIEESICQTEALQALLDEVLLEIEKLEQKIEASQEPIALLLQRIRKLNIVFPRQPNKSGGIPLLSGDFDVSDAGVGSDSVEPAIKGRVVPLNLFFMSKKQEVKDLEARVKELLSRVGLSLQVDKPCSLEELDKKLMQAMGQRQELQENLSFLFHEIEMLNQDLSNHEDDQWHDSADVLSQGLDKFKEIISSQSDSSGVVVPIITEFSMPGFKSGEVPERKGEILGEHEETEAEIAQLHELGLVEMRRYPGEGFGIIKGIARALVKALRLLRNRGSTFCDMHELNSLAHHLGNGLWVLHGKTKGSHLQSDYNLIIDLEEDMEASLLKVEEFLTTRVGLSRAHEELVAKVNELVIQRDALLDAAKSLLQETKEVKERLSSHADKALQDIPDGAQKNDRGLHDLRAGLYQEMDTNADIEPAGHVF